MLTNRHLEIAEALFDLEPAATYPRRAADAVAQLVTAQGFRLELEKDAVESQPAPAGSPGLSLVLRDTEGQALGTLHLYGTRLGEAEIQIVRWAVRLFGRGLRYSRRISHDGTQRSVEDVQAMLERTPLTPRERDVVGLLLSGASTRLIAESTGLTVATVNTYLKRIFAKLGVHSRVELVARVTGTVGVITPVAGGKDQSAQA